MCNVRLKGEVYPSSSIKNMCIKNDNMFKTKCKFLLLLCRKIIVNNIVKPKSKLKSKQKNNPLIFIELIELVNKK